MTDNSQDNGATHQLGDIINAFWQSQVMDIETGATDIKSLTLPLARIKRVMKSDEEVKVLYNRIILNSKWYSSWN
jgi:hypothetical protein